jgi:hypothetical protein
MLVLTLLHDPLAVSWKMQQLSCLWWKCLVLNLSRDTLQSYRCVHFYDLRCIPHNRYRTCLEQRVTVLYVSKYIFLFHIAMQFQHWCSRTHFCSIQRTVKWEGKIPRYFNKDPNGGRFRSEFFKIDSFQFPILGWDSLGSSFLPSDLYSSCCCYICSGITSLLIIIIIHHQ